MSFVSLAPQFGKSPKGEYLKKILDSKHYSDGKFQNLIPTSMDMGLKDGIQVMYKWITNTDGRVPKAPLPVSFSDDKNVNNERVALTWFGHSAFLLKINEKKILIDPMLGPAASPVSFVTKRFAYEQALDLDKMSEVDAVILSHDHYDHLDYKTITQLKDRVNHFYTPLGVGSHLIRWGVDPSRISELDWWETANIEEVEVIAAPARHFSGRGLTDRNKTQWASWIIRNGDEKIYFSGDSGYGPHFREIGEKYGPFDFAMMECGQYNEKWEAIHMMPEQTIQASLDLNCRKVMPIHWGAFNLSLHAWTEPIERAIKAANGNDIDVITPRIGQLFNWNDSIDVKDQWWKGY